MKREYFHNRVPTSVWRNPWHFIAFGCGSGAAPVGPGTVATAIAMVIYLLLLKRVPWLPYVIFVVIFTLFSIWLANKVSRETGLKDPPGMNIDEFVGYFVTMIAAPPQWYWALIGFGLFRFFDIFKPPLINWIDKHLKGGPGIILDDVLAGIFSAIGIQIIFWLQH
ncbi:MAG: phosphatidylglycerophosphatase A [Gammaproteobacteria bacterium]|nr:phosphatidylglycerophosphatase A [Gammaproteobacteria bacterium]